MKKLAIAAVILISVLVIWFLNHVTRDMAEKTRQIQKEFVEAQSAPTNAPATNVAKAKGGPVIIRTSVGLGVSKDPTPRPTNQMGQVVGNGTQQ